MAPVDYYLVSASRIAHRLRPDRSYVFGREEGVDIPLQDALVSRRHAELVWAESAWEVKDLGSRNGVFVEGVRIVKPTQLEDGAQLQIGGHVFRHFLLPPGTDLSTLRDGAPDLGNVETRDHASGSGLLSLKNQSATFSGKVGDGGVFELFQFFAAARRTGRLDFAGGAAVASVWFQGGTPVHATLDGAVGNEALVRLGRARPCDFTFHADPEVPRDRSLEGTLNGILMEVARRLDEGTG
jgi:hypothetical protein